MGLKWLRDGGPKRCIRAFLRDQQGATLVFIAIALFASAGVAALAVDMGYFYLLKGRLQTTADVAALAAVRQLPDQNALRTAALEYAPKNMPTYSVYTVNVTPNVNDVIVLISLPRSSVAIIDMLGLFQSGTLTTSVTMLTE